MKEIFIIKAAAAVFAIACSGAAWADCGCENVQVTYTPSVPAAEYVPLTPGDLGVGAVVHETVNHSNGLLAPDYSPGTGPQYRGPAVIFYHGQAQQTTAVAERLARTAEQQGIAAPTETSVAPNPVSPRQHVGPMAPTPGESVETGMGRAAGMGIIGPPAGSYGGGSTGTYQPPSAYPVPPGTYPRGPNPPVPELEPGGREGRPF